MASRFLFVVAGLGAFAASALAAPALVALDLPAVADVPAATASDAAAGTTRQVGYARPIPALSTAAGMAEQLRWTPLAEGGAVAALTVRSAGAAALRVGLRVGSLPEGTLLHFYPPAGTPAYEVKAAEIAAAFARNGHAGDRDGAARTFWSPIVEGDAIVIEVEIPRAAERDAVRIASPMLSHFVVSPARRFATADASLADETLARVVYTRDGDSFVCAGTLVAATAAPPGIPYFLAAPRCIADQSAASSMQPYWYRAARVQTLTGGATLLYGGAEGEPAFVRLHAPPPAGTHYAQWPGPEIRALAGDAEASFAQWLGGSAGAAQLAAESALAR